MGEGHAAIVCFVGQTLDLLEDSSNGQPLEQPCSPSLRFDTPEICGMLLKLSAALN